MPWPNAKSFRKHNKKAVGKRGNKAARMATHVLESTGDEGEAIATANKWLSKQRGHNSPGPGPHAVRGVSFMGGGGAKMPRGTGKKPHAGSHAPRPGERGTKVSSTAVGHRFGALSTRRGGGLI